MKAVVYLLLSVFIAALLSNETKAQQKVVIVVTDQSTGKPVEGAEVSFKTLLGKYKRKTNSEGKAFFEFITITNSQNLNYTVNYTGANNSYKAYTGTITINSSQKDYQFAAAIVPDSRKISFRITDNNQRPVSNATVRLKNSQGVESVSTTDANGNAQFEIASSSNYSNASLTVSKAGSAPYTIPVQVNEQTSQFAVVAPINDNQAIFVDGTSTTGSGGATQLGTTNGQVVRNIKSSPGGVYGPYTPACNSNPIAEVSTYSPYAVEDERSLLEYLGGSCVEKASELVDAMLSLSTQLTKLASECTAYYTEKNRKPAPDGKTGQNSNEKIVTAFVENQGKAAYDVQDKLNELKDAITKLKTSPAMYFFDCMKKGFMKYGNESLAEQHKNISEIEKNINEAGEAAKKTVAGKDANERSIAFALFAVKDKLESAAKGLNIIYTFLTDPSSFLSYKLQAEIAVGRVEDMMGTLLTDCNIRQCEQELTKGVLAGQSALAAARKYKAQQLKEKDKARQELNDYVAKNNRQQNRGWETWLPGDERLKDLPVSEYNRYVVANNRALEQDRQIKDIENTLNKLAAFCPRIQSMAPTLNQRVATYEKLYDNGLKEMHACRIENAEKIVAELRKLESSPCGHYFPDAFGQFKSEALQDFITIARQSKCKPAIDFTGRYVLTGNSGVVATLVINHSGNTASATTESRGPGDNPWTNTGGVWSDCKIEGNTLKCNWSCTYQDNDKTGKRSGTVTATLDGDMLETLSIEGEDPKWAWKKNEGAYTSSMHKGARWPGTYRRIN